MEYLEWDDAVMLAERAQEYKEKRANRDFESLVDLVQALAETIVKSDSNIVQSIGNLSKSIGNALR